MKLVLTDALTMNPGDLSWEELENLGEVSIHEHTRAEDLLARVGDAEVIIANKTVINSQTISNCPNLKLICVSATGYNNIDLEAAREQGVLVCNAANYSSESVAQHVIAMILHVYNEIARYSKSVHEGRWSKSRDFTYYDQPIELIHGKTFGIVGYGNLGKQVAGLASAFGAEVVIMADPRAKHIESKYQVLPRQEFLQICDIISLHVPLNSTTKKLVDTKFLAEMKSTAILVNTARGQVVDSLALSNSLKTKGIRAACIDVLEQEPPAASPLFGLDNCVITPHQAWASKLAREKLLSIVIDNIRSFQSGNPINLVG